MLILILRCLFGLFVVFIIIAAIVLGIYEWAKGRDVRRNQGQKIRY